MPKDKFTFTEAADYLVMKRSTLYNHAVHRKLIPFTKQLNKMYFLKEDLDQYKVQYQ